MVSRPAIVHLRPKTGDLAASIAKAIGGDIYQPTGDVAGFLRSLFRDGRPIVGILSAGIIIRALARLIEDKHSEPPVLAVSFDASSVVPLLGGHRGANRLARTIAEATGAWPALSTASDLEWSIALDEPPDGYSLSNVEHYKSFASRLLDGEPVHIVGHAPWLAALPQSPDATIEIAVTDKDIESSPTRLVYHSASLAVGVGCERHTSTEEVQSVIAETLRAHGLARSSVAAFASIDLKEDEPAINALGHVRFFTAKELDAESHRIKNPSELVMREVGCPSVAEASALAAAGPDAELIVEKTRSAHATCAVARAPAPILVKRGRPRGHLFVVGLGPGDESSRSPQAARSLLEASDWVGYGPYLDLAKDLKFGQTEHRFELGEEERRVRHAIKLAGEGRAVALISSGDAGIYAMASLVYEVIESEPARIAVEVVPGISAFQAAAARAGALIGHDFCCISLSDLLTPWEAIEKRVRAAAEADFVTAFYNPRSARRTDQLSRALAILKPCRRPDTPVVVASNLGRPEEKVRIVPLSAFDPSEVDMLTVVLVGSSDSRCFTRGDGTTIAYTPRGYGRKVRP